MAENLLEVNNLKTYFFTRSGVVKAVDDVSFVIKPSQTLGIVGESGCGKSVTALSIMRLIATPPGKIVGGEINFNGENILEKNLDELTDLRGSQISMIFQDLVVVAGTCHPVNVMYAGHLVESAPVKQIFATPAHPYTVGLLRSIPRMDEKHGSSLTPIGGQPPDLSREIIGCPYAPRCPKVQNRCRQERPELKPVGRGEQVAACFYPD